MNLRTLFFVFLCICAVGCKDSKQPKTDANSHEAEKAKTVDSVEISHEDGQENKVHRQ